MSGTKMKGMRRLNRVQNIQPVAATLTKNVFLWLATFGQNVKIDPVAQ